MASGHISVDYTCMDCGNKVYAYYMNEPYVRFYTGDEYEFSPAMMWAEFSLAVRINSKYRTGLSLSIVY